MEHLYEYIVKSRSQIVQQINIKEQIKIWRRSHRNQNPTILIDLEQFRNVFAQRDQTGILLGGRYPIYNILFKHFVDELLTNKIKLKFFSAAHQTSDELSLFIPKMELEYYRHIQKMESDAKNATNDRNPCVPATIEHNLIDLIQELCSKDALHINYFRHNQEIVQYALAHSDDVLAIISNDLHLLLFEGSYQFWCANDTNLRTLNTISMCRKTLETAINLNTKQLQLLSVLIGSPYLPSEIVDRHFLPTLNIQVSAKIEQLAHYIKQTSLTSHFNLEQIAIDFRYPFGSTNDIINAIQNGLNCYETTFSVTTLCEDAFTKFSKQRNSFIYTLIIDDVYLVKDVAFIDYRWEGKSSYAELVVPLLQKMMGILFKNNTIKPMDRKICMKFAHDEPHRVVRIPIIYPQIGLPPDLFDLIYKNREKRYETTRWSLLKWLFDIDEGFYHNLCRLRGKYTAVVLTLYYLLQQSVISILEADAILCCEHEARERKNDEMPSKIPYPHPIHIQYVRIAHLYTKMFVLINRCLEVCGLNRQTALLQFDGPHFYMTLETLTKLEPTDLDKALSKVSDIRIYLTESTI